MLSRFLAIVLEAVTELAREGVLSELLYDDDLVLTSETIEGLSSQNGRRLSRARV